MRAPTVKTFLGCCDLKCSCMVIAVFRMVTSIILLIAIVVILFVYGLPKALYENDKLQIIDFMHGVYIGFGCVIILANVLGSYCFILGTTSNEPHRMKFYLVMEVINVVLYVPLCIFFAYAIIVVAVIECYIIICSHSLYQELLNSNDEVVIVNVNHENTNDNKVILSPHPGFKVFLL